MYKQNARVASVMIHTRKNARVVMTNLFNGLVQAQLRG